MVFRQSYIFESIFTTHLPPCPGISSGIGTNRGTNGMEAVDVVPDTMVRKSGPKQSSDREQQHDHDTAASALRSAPSSSSATAADARRSRVEEQHSDNRQGGRDGQAATVRAGSCPLCDCSTKGAFSLPLLWPDPPPQPSLAHRAIF